MTNPFKTGEFSVSVVIPTHNRLEFLPHALDSVFSQTQRVNEIIVVDDGSTDNTVEILHKRYKEVSFIKQRNQGVSAARNTGIKASKHHWIAFLDSDDQWVSDKIEKQISYLSYNPNLKACHTQEKWIRNGNQVQLPAYFNKSNEGLFQRSLERCVICPSSVILHHSIFQTIGLFDPSLKICEDYDFWLRLLLSESIHFINEPLVEKYGGHPDQLSTSTWGLDRFRVQSLEKILQNEKLADFQKVETLKTMIKKYRLLALGFRKHKKEKEAIVYEQKITDVTNQLSKLSSVITS